MEWSDGVLAVVQHVWKESGQALCDKPKDVLTVGQVSMCIHVWGRNVLLVLSIQHVHVHVHV